MSSSMNYASAIAVFTPQVPSFPVIAFRADVFLNEEEMIGEPTPDKDRAKPFMSNDGQTIQYIDIFSISGKRDISIIEGDESEALQRMAFSNPQPMFNLSFRYQRNDQDATKVREQYHTDCKFMNHGIRVISNEIVLVKFNFHYGKILPLDNNGNLVS